MTIARTASEVLSDHVTLEIEGIDRLYLNLYVPILQNPRGIGLAEPALRALTNIPYKRTENFGVVRVGENISFQDGVFLMIDNERSPIEGRGQARWCVSGDCPSWNSDREAHWSWFAR